MATVGLYSSAAMVAPPVQVNSGLSKITGMEVFVQRDDLLPFPLAGNKVRKISAELAAFDDIPDVVITNGGVDSNHCRTLAMFSAARGFHAHLVLHASRDDENARALAMLSDLGASYQVVRPEGIASAIEDARLASLREGRRVGIIPGGCHTPSGARACRNAALPIFETIRPDYVVVASGTGATQGGLIAASELSSHRPVVLGVSVARRAERGIAPVREAAMWAGATAETVQFTDNFLGGGYGMQDDEIRRAVALGWRSGLPVDGTYTGKALAGMLDFAAREWDQGSRVLFWHTGGLWNYLSGSE